MSVNVHFGAGGTKRKSEKTPEEEASGSAPIKPRANLYCTSSYTGRVWRPGQPEPRDPNPAPWDTTFHEMAQSRLEKIKTDQYLSSDDVRPIFEGGLTMQSGVGYDALLLRIHNGYIAIEKVNLRVPFQDFGVSAHYISPLINPAVGVSVDDIKSALSTVLDTFIFETRVDGQIKHQFV
jgi:hypothetical protein